MRERWDRFLVTFFGEGNGLDYPSTTPAVIELLEANEQLLAADPPGPFLLPRRTSAGDTVYYAIALTDEQALELRRVLGGIVGGTYTDFAGRSVRSDFGDTVLASAIALAGDERRLFAFRPVASDRAATREQVSRLLHLMSKRPRRAVALIRPFGRLLRDFDRALDARDEVAARSLLHEGIFASGRLSGRNRLFLQVRFLAAFERWEELECLPSLPDLLRAPMPALVADSLAALAVHDLHTNPEPSQSSAAERFESIASGFGALVPTADRIRSVSGAEYYVRWCLGAGDDGAAILDRLEALAWVEAPEVAAILGEVAPVSGRQPSTPDVQSITAAVVAGRIEYALELLEQVEPSPELLPLLLHAVRQTLSMAAIGLLARFRSTLGDVVVDEAVEDFHGGLDPMALPSGLNWGDRIRQAAAGELRPGQLEEAAREDDLLALARDPDRLDELVEAVQSTTSAANSTSVLDVVLRLLARLETVLPERVLGRLTPLRLATLRLWALADDSGDQARASDLIDVADELVHAGCSVVEFEELVELLTLRWDALLTDRAFGLGVRALEVLASGRPAGSPVVSTFATPLLSRVTVANVQRLDVVDVLAADALSDELELGYSLVALVPPGAMVAEASTHWAGTIGLYSLDENALRRAADSLQRVLPDAELRTSHEKVANEPLRSLARAADVMVIASKVAKHPATDAIRAERAGPLTFAAGKGSSSLVRAALERVKVLGQQEPVTAGVGGT